MTLPLHVHNPLPGEGPITLRRGASAFLEHIALKVESGEMSRERMLNLARNLTRYVEAWYVVLADGRPVLVPRAEAEQFEVRPGVMQRRRRLRWQAADAAEAYAVAKQIAAGMVGGLRGLTPIGAPEPVRVNGERPLGECTSDDLRRWLIVNPQWRSDYSKKDALEAVVTCFGWYEDEYKVASPYVRSRLPEFKHKKPRREARIDEYVKLMRHNVGIVRGRLIRVPGSSRELRRALWCLYNVQGLRPGTMRNLVWSDFDWEGGFVKIVKHKTAEATGKALIIALTARQLRFFRNLHRQRPPWPENVFLNTDGKPWTKRSFGLHLRRTCQRIGLDDGAGERVTAYCFRHTFATQADEAGALRSDTAMLMGHSNEKMIREVYSKASQHVRHVRGAAERMEQLRRKARRDQRREEKRRDGEQGGLF